MPVTESLSLVAYPIVCYGIYNSCFCPLCIHYTSRSFIVGYIGEDCSLAADAVPVISSFRRGCTCDVRQLRCARVFVTASDIHDQLNLTCRVQSADLVSLRNNSLTLLN